MIISYFYSNSDRGISVGFCCLEDKLLSNRDDQREKAITVLKRSIQGRELITKGKRDKRGKDKLQQKKDHQVCRPVPCLKTHAHFLKTPFRSFPSISLFPRKLHRDAGRSVLGYKQETVIQIQRNPSENPIKLQGNAVADFSNPVGRGSNRSRRTPPPMLNFH
jgi:hypothetical protein